MSNETALAPVAKRRGRPPGSKNKPKAAGKPMVKAANTAKSGSGGASMMDALLAYMKAKPQAVFADAKAAMEKAGHKLFPISWGRAQLLLGRVKKGAGKTAKKVEKAVSGAVAAVASVGAPVKRGRGRPRKHPLPITVAPTAVVARVAGGVSIPVAASDVGAIQAFVDATNAGGRIELRYAHGGWSLTVAT